MVLLFPIGSRLAPGPAAISRFCARERRGALHVPDRILELKTLLRGLAFHHPARNRSIAWGWLTLRRLRRLSQIVFLLLFVVLLCRTGDPFRPAVRLFLESDPFASAVNALATHALYRGLLWSLAILIPTLFLGRFFCGWVCPLGTLHHLASSIRSRSKSGRRRIESNRYQPWQALKYYLLVALLATAAAGSAVAGLFDPISLTVRSFALSLLPAWNYALGLGYRGPHFRQAFLTAAILIALLALNLRVTRFWCRALCPLGALMGLAARGSILGLEKRRDQCGECRRCLLHCQGGDDPLPGARWRKAECHLCLNCVADCPEAALRFRFFPAAGAAREAPALDRRRALAGLAAGAAAVPLLRANTGFGAEPHERRIRPPAALDEPAFLARCIRCGECMKVCPSNALQPAVAEAGWEGVWTPIVVPRVGYCEPGCTLCGQVCPTGAIWEFGVREKGWSEPEPGGPPIRIGTAFFDRGRCLPWAMATNCIVCEEWCPTSPKAIYLRPSEAAGRDGKVGQVRQPYVDPELCVGCGACEFACPLRERPAVYVTSAGESRSKTNRVLLSGTPAPCSPALPESGEAPGWTKQGETRTFAAADLWQYVDGDAERYLRAGVRRTMTASYRYGDAVEAVADVHELQSPAGAAALFDSEPAAGSRPLPIGNAARTYGQSLTFHRGRFFVRLTAYQDTPQTGAALADLARAVNKRLGR